VNVLSNNKGFSLIELMVVVAIIAILSTIAIPSYQTFQAKARQKEGFALLGAYYSAANATRAEYGSFPGNFVATGFSPSGMLGYRVTAANNMAFVFPYAGNISNDAACINTAAACTCGGMCASFMQWTENPAGAVGATLGPWATTMAGMATAQAFQAFAGGVIDVRATIQDEWRIDEQKLLFSVTDGTK
jgi:type IV pilus assembly protein PilA